MCTANLDKLLGGPKTLADTWTRWQNKVNLALPHGARGTAPKKLKLALTCKAQSGPWQRENITPKRHGNEGLAPERWQESIFHFYRAIRLVKDRFKRGNGNGVLCPPHLRPRRNGQDCTPGGPLESGRTTNDFSYEEFRLQEMAIPL